MSVTRVVVSGLLLAASAQLAVAVPPLPALPGDCNSDWSVDMLDFADVEACLSGPDVAIANEYECHDTDGDGDVDLRDFAAFQPAFTGTQCLSYRVDIDADDGTEVNDSVWYDDGYAGSGHNLMGAVGAESYDVGLRFHLPDVQQGENFVYARLVVHGSGAGQVDSEATLRIVGVAQDSPDGFDVARPSELPKTVADAAWHISSNWPEPDVDGTCTPLRRYSPDVSDIINEIVSRPDWGTGASGKTLVLVIEDDACADANFLAIEDYRELGGQCPGTKVHTTLELYRTVRSTFVAKELLGCPTANSVTLNALSLLPLEIYFELGYSSGDYNSKTLMGTYVGGEPIEVVLDTLLPDTRYFYRMRYRRPGEQEYSSGPERSFHTQRSASETFSFTVQSDSHLQDLLLWAATGDGLSLYRTALRNASADASDFHFCMGDTFHCESYAARDVVDYEEAVRRHLDQRPLLDLVCHSAPFFFAVGNHEGEQGWRLDGSPDNVAIWAANARKHVYPLPAPDAFYTGGTDNVPYVGLRESYYAWEWGNALFVVLDPYWYTTSKPHGAGGTPGSGDNWDWTLGQEQYDWLCQTLENSAATFKFVFAHQVTGGVTTYGRGGIEAACYALGWHGSFEWGGEDLFGNYVFDTKRPGWGRPIHDVLVDNNVTIFFHGHDHVFVHQVLDGVVYQECPQPSDSAYRSGFYYFAGYLYGVKVNNSGHVRVTVSPSQVTVEYIRAYLPGDGTNGQVAYSYSIPAPGP